MPLQAPIHHAEDAEVNIVVCGDSWSPNFGGNGCTFGGPRRFNENTTDYYPNDMDIMADLGTYTSPSFLSVYGAQDQVSKYLPTFPAGSGLETLIYSQYISSLITRFTRGRQYHHIMKLRGSPAWTASDGRNASQITNNSQIQQIALGGSVVNTSPPVGYNPGTFALPTGPNLQRGYSQDGIFLEEALRLFGVDKAKVNRFDFSMVAATLFDTSQSCILNSWFGATPGADPKGSTGGGGLYNMLRLKDIGQNLDPRFGATGPGGAYKFCRESEAYWGVSQLFKRHADSVNAIPGFGVVPWVEPAAETRLPYIDPDTGLPIEMWKVIKNPPGGLPTVIIMSNVGNDFLARMQENHSSRGPGQITDASNTTPIRITNSVPHGLTNGAAITVQGVLGNTAANTSGAHGTFWVTVIDATRFDVYTNVDRASGHAAVGTGAMTGADPTIGAHWFIGDPLLAVPYSYSSGQPPKFWDANPTEAAAVRDYVDNVQNAYTPFPDGSGYGTFSQALANGARFAFDNFRAWNPNVEIVWPSYTNWAMDEPDSPRINVSTGVGLGPGSITAASNTTPIRITNSVPHGLANGAYVTTAGITGNTAASGHFYVKVINATEFDLYSNADLASAHAVAGNGVFTPPPPPGGATWSVGTPGISAPTTNWQDGAGDWHAPLEVEIFIPTGNVSSVQLKNPANGTYLQTVVSQVLYYVGYNAAGTQIQNSSARLVTNVDTVTGVVTLSLPMGFTPSGATAKAVLRNYHYFWIGSIGDGFTGFLRDDGRIQYGYRNPNFLDPYLNIDTIPKMLFFPAAQPTGNDGTHDLSDAPNAGGIDTPLWARTFFAMNSQFNATYKTFGYSDYAVWASHQAADLYYADARGQYNIDSNANRWTGEGYQFFVYNPLDKQKAFTITFPADVAGSMSTDATGTILGSQGGSGIGAFPDTWDHYRSVFERLQSDQAMFGINPGCFVPHVTRFFINDVVSRITKHTIGTAQTSVEAYYLAHPTGSAPAAGKRRFFAPQVWNAHVDDPRDPRPDLACRGVSPWNPDGNADVASGSRFMFIEGVHLARVGVESFMDSVLFNWLPESDVMAPLVKYTYIPVEVDSDLSFDADDARMARTGSPTTRGDRCVGD